MMSRIYFGKWSSWQVRMAAMAIVESRPCFEVKIFFIAAGSVWENGSIESFNDKLRVEQLNG